MLPLTLSAILGAEDGGGQVRVERRPVLQKHLPMMSHLHLRLLWADQAVRIQVGGQLLALRYTLDPTHLDPLAIIPGLILSIARLRSDIIVRKANPGALKSMPIIMASYLSLLGLALLFVHYQTPHLWIGLPDRLIPSLSLRFWVLLGISYIYLLGYFAFVYSKEPRDRYLGFAIRLLYAPLEYPERVDGRVQKEWCAMTVHTTNIVVRYAMLIRRFFVYVVFLSMLIPLVLSCIPVHDFFQEVLIPLLACWPSVFFWLSVKQNEIKGEQHNY